MMCQWARQIAQSVALVRGSEGIRRIENGPLRDRSDAMPDPAQVESIFFAALESACRPAAVEKIRTSACSAAGYEDLVDPRSPQPSSRPKARRPTARR